MVINQSTNYDLFSLSDLASVTLNDSRKNDSDPVQSDQTLFQQSLVSAFANFFTVSAHHT